MKHTLTIFTILVTAITVQAQSKVSTTRQAVKTVVMPTPLATRQLNALRVSGMEGLAGALELRCTQAMMTRQTPPLSTIPATSKVKDRPWLVQQRRNFKAWQLKHQRRARDKQNLKEEQARQAREALEATFPRENREHTLEVGSFEPLLANDLPAEPLPLLEQPGVLYRGMALDPQGNALENILIHGLRLQDLGNHATTKLLAMSGGLHGNVSSISSHPVTNLSSYPDEALFWATQRVGTDKELMVIVAVNGQTQSGKAVLLSEDIPVSRITHVFAPLTIVDRPVWCKIELTSENIFLVTPYDLPPLVTTSVTEK